MIEIDNLLRRVAECHEIPRMNEHIPSRHAQFGVLAALRAWVPPEPLPIITSFQDVIYSFPFRRGFPC